jgi:hypothetical protein
MTWRLSSVDISYLGNWRNRLQIICRIWVLSSEIQRCVVRSKWADVSEEHIVSIFKVEE